MKFTEDWFSDNIDNFKKCMASTPEHGRFLEVGVFEGRSTCWLLENGLNKDGTIVCIDAFAFEPSQYNNLSGQEAMTHFVANYKEVCLKTQTVKLMRNWSYYALSDLIINSAPFDFIYIDGSHDPRDTLKDACMAWGLLKRGGVMLFDDYQYPHEDTKSGIDAFLSVFGKDCEIIVNNYQLGVKKCQQ